MKYLLLLATLGLFYGCATMLPGKIIALEDGTVLPMQIQTSYGTGEMTAFNPKTNENFKGTYTGVMSYSFSNSNGMIGNVAYNGNAVTRSNQANAKAVLIGDKGRY